MLRMTRFALLMLILPAIASGQAKPDTQPAEPASPESPTVIRVYNVSDLIESAHNYPYKSSIVPPNQLPAGRSQSFAELQAEQPTTRPSPVEQQADLQRLIRDTVAPDSWRDNGGTIGSVAPFGPGLVITQTQENHQAITNLLEQLRTEIGFSSRQVTVRFIWLLLPPGQLETLLKAPGANGGPAEIDPAVLSKHPELIRYSGQASCYSGQMIHLASGRARTAILSAEPVVAQSSSAYNVDASLILSGVLVEFTPKLSTDGKNAVIDLRSVVSDVPAQKADLATTQPAIDRLDLLAHQLATTVRMPVKRPIVVGGMTLEPDSTANAPQLYLVVEISPGG